MLSPLISSRAALQLSEPWGLEPELGRQDTDALAQALGPAPGWLLVRLSRTVLLGDPTDVFWTWHQTLRGAP